MSRDHQNFFLLFHKRCYRPCNFSMHVFGKDCSNCRQVPIRAKQSFSQYQKLLQQFTTTTIKSLPFSFISQKPCSIQNICSSANYVKSFLVISDNCPTAIHYRMATTSNLARIAADNENENEYIKHRRTFMTFLRQLFFFGNC